MAQEDTSTSGEGTGCRGAILSLAAIVVSVIALFQSWAANSLSAKNVHIAETQLVVASMPSLQASYYVSESLSLDTPEDRAFIEGLGLSPTIIKSGYWRSAGTSAAPDQARFLFILVSNYGPGTATRLSISGEWIPKEGSSPPMGLLDLEGPIPLLPPGRFLALLVDIIDGYDPVGTLANQSGTHFKSLHFVVTHEDATGTPGFLEVNAPDLPPAIIEPGI